MLFLITLIQRLVRRHRVVLVALALAAAGPSLVMLLPAVMSKVAELAPQAKFAIFGVAITLAIAALVAFGKWARRAIVRTGQRFEGFVRRRQESDVDRRHERDRQRAFKRDGLPGHDSVVMVEVIGGSIYNVFFEFGTLLPVLEAELAKAGRGVLVKGDTAPGVGVDTPPDLILTPVGEVAAYSQ